MHSIRYLRTQSKVVISEATVAYYIRNVIFLSLGKNRDLNMTKIIREKQGGAEKKIFLRLLNITKLLTVQ